MPGRVQRMGSGLPRAVDLVAHMRPVCTVNSNTEHRTLSDTWAV